MCTDQKTTKGEIVILVGRHLSEVEIDKICGFKCHDLGIKVFQVIGKDEVQKVLNLPRVFDLETNDSETTPERRAIMLKARQLAQELNNYCLENKIGEFYLADHGRIKLSWYGNPDDNLSIQVE